MNKNKTNKIGSLFIDAIKFRDSGNIPAAIEKFREILDENRRSDTAILGMMGNIYLNSKDFPQAYDCYRKAVKLNAESELASLGLFHTLCNMERESEAFAEAKRFLSIRESEEYFLLIEEMRDSLNETTTVDMYNNHKK